MAWTYIIKCADDSYYVGSTPHLEFRMAQHRDGIGSTWTAARRPLKLVFCYEVHRIEDAFYLERQVKGWRRKKKEALIAGRYDLLPDLAHTATDAAEFRRSRDPTR